MAGRIKVLLADESVAMRLLLTALLRDDERFVVVGDVANGTEIIDRSGDADLVVLDLVLADMDAFTVIDRLHVERPKLPVVLFAQVDPPYLRSEAASRGVAGFFTPAMDAATVLDGFASAVTGGHST